jgi:tripartite ATP-independent transporter DctM subunit
MGSTLILAFFILLFLGMPIAYVLSITGLMSLVLMSTVPLKVLPQMMWVSLDSFPLMALPFFILAGEIMNQSGITKSLINLSKLLVGKYKGGLAYASIVASTFFASISGSASATAAAVGGMLIPPMVEDGYDKDFTAATITAASVVGPIIPPSTSMVILAVTAGVSVGGLFLAGYIPGILYSLGLMLYVRYKARKYNFPTNELVLTTREKISVIKYSLPAVLMPLIILGGILGGIFTATEAAAMACVYGLFVGFFYTKNLSVKNLPKMFIRTAVITASIDLILATSNILGWSLTVFQIPQQVTQYFLSISTNPYVILLLINVLLLIMGCFMEIVVTIIMLTPILFPLVRNRYVFSATHRTRPELV